MTLLIGKNPYIHIFHARIKSGYRGSDTPSPEKHKNIGFLRNTGPDPLKNYKVTKPAKCHLNDVLLAGR